MAALRLPSLSTDILVSLSAPQADVSTGSSAHARFAALLGSLRVVDFGLFTP
jgi:hypothetical protein